ARAAALLDPQGKRREEAKQQIADAVDELRKIERFFNELLLPKDLKAQLEEYADALTMAGRVSQRLRRPPFSVQLPLSFEDLSFHAESARGFARALPLPPARTRDPVKAKAVRLAQEALIAFDIKPKKTRKAVWHSLSNRLYELATESSADLFTY